MNFQPTMLILGLNIVGADIVEVSPAFDGRGEQTALAAAQVVYEMLTSVVKRGIKERGTRSEQKENLLKQGETVKIDVQADTGKDEL